jgi:hypothetical protein
MATDATTPALNDAPTTELIPSQVGSHCANCHAPMAADQRYCLNCGERRGRPRFSVGGASTHTVTEVVTESPAPPPRTARGAGLTLVAGIATLLIAMGVGVLIGQKSSPSSPGQTKVIQLGGGSSGTAANAGTGSTQASTGTSKHTHAARTKAAKNNAAKTKVVVVHLTPKVQKAATKAAAKVFGSSGHLSKNVTQNVGGSCASGTAGCQNGKFTGGFFSP